MRDERLMSKGILSLYKNGQVAGCYHFDNFKVAYNGKKIIKNDPLVIIHNTNKVEKFIRYHFCFNLDYEDNRIDEMISTVAVDQSFLQSMSLDIEDIYSIFTFEDGDDNYKVSINEFKYADQVAVISEEEKQEIENNLKKLREGTFEEDSDEEDNLDGIEEWNEAFDEEDSEEVKQENREILEDRIEKDFEDIDFSDFICTDPNFDDYNTLTISPKNMEYVCDASCFTLFMNLRHGGLGKYGIFELTESVYEFNGSMKKFIKVVEGLGVELSQEVKELLCNEQEKEANEEEVDKEDSVEESISINKEDKLKKKFEEVYNVENIFDKKVDYLSNKDLVFLNKKIVNIESAKKLLKENGIEMEEGDEIERFDIVSKNMYEMFDGINIDTYPNMLLKIYFQDVLKELEKYSGKGMIYNYKDQGILIVDKKHSNDFRQYLLSLDIEEKPWRESPQYIQKIYKKDHSETTKEKVEEGKTFKIVKSLINASLDGEPLASFSLESSDKDLKHTLKQFTKWLLFYRSIWWPKLTRDDLDSTIETYEEIVEENGKAIVSAKFKVDNRDLRVDFFQHESGLF